MFSGAAGPACHGIGAGRWGKEFFHHAGRVDGRPGERGLNGGLNEVAHLPVNGIEPGGVAGGGELGAEFRQRILRNDGLGLAGLHVIAGVVGGVAAQAERVRLDQHRPAGGADAVDGCAEGRQDVRRVTAIHREALHAVALGAFEEIGGDELFADRRRVGVLVVLDDEHHRRGEQRREVERLVDVAGAR